MKQNGSPASKRITPGRVKRQFMVKGNGSQSVSTSPSRATMPSLTVLGAPRVHTAQPGEVRNSQPVWKVITPWPKCEVTEWRSRAVAGAELDRAELVAAVPGRLEGERQRDLPAAGVGDRERDAAVGVALAGHVHPVAVGRPGLSSGEVGHSR